MAVKDKQLITEFNFKLSKPIKYADTNIADEVLSVNVVLKCPQGKHRNYLIPLKQKFFRAMMDLSSRDRNVKNESNEDSDDINKMTGQSIMMLLYMSNIDMVEFLDQFKKMLLQGLIYIDNVPMHSVMFDQIDPDDFEKIVGEYISNFLVSSWLGSLKTS